MRRMRALILLGVVAVVAGDAAAVEPDLSSPKAAAKSLYQAVEASDAAAVRKVLQADDAGQRELAAAFAELLVAGKSLTDAASKRFGQAGEEIGQAMVGKDEPARIDAAEEKRSGDTATLVFPGQSRPMTFRQSGGKWRLRVMDYAGATPENLPRQLAMLRRITSVLEQSAREIGEGRYATVDDARKAVEGKLHGVMIDILRANPPATQPG